MNALTFTVVLCVYGMCIGNRRNEGSRMFFNDSWNVYFRSICLYVCFVTKQPVSYFVMTFCKYYPYDDRELRCIVTLSEGIKWDFAFEHKLVHFRW